MNRELDAYTGKKAVSIGYAPLDSSQLDGLTAVFLVFDDGSQLNLTVTRAGGHTKSGSWEWPFHPSVGEPGILVVTHA